MDIKIAHQPSYAMAVCNLEEGESIKAESGAMLSMSSNVDIATSSGGVFKGLKKALLGGESFFTNVFTAKDAPGEVCLAPTMPGDIVNIPMDGELIIQGTSFLASDTEIDLDTKYKGFKGLFSGEGMFMLKASGRGNILVNCFGAIHPVEVDGEYIVDTGHVVAFESTLDYKVKSVGGIMATLFSGEGLISRFSGKGKLWIQSRNPDAYGKLLGSHLPPRE